MKIYTYSLLIVSFILFLSCEKETEGISRITEYATFEMQGAEFIFVLTNSSFTDPGIAAFEGETELSVETKGAVNTAVTDVYTIQYTAKNSDGFPASVERKVAVVNTLPTTDLSGTYQIIHATRTNRISVTKYNGIVGYYRASDSWFQASPIPLDFVDMGDGTIKVLQGSSPYGPHYGSGTILPGGQIRFLVYLPGQSPTYNYTTTYQLQ